MFDTLAIDVLDPTGTELLNEIPKTATPMELDNGTK